MFFLFKFIVLFSLSRIKWFWKGYKSSILLSIGEGVGENAWLWWQDSALPKKNYFWSLIMKRETKQQNSPRVGKIGSYSEVAENQINHKVCFRGTEGWLHTLSVTAPLWAQQSPAEAVRERQCCWDVWGLQRGGDGEEKLHIQASAFFPFNKLLLVILLNKHGLKSTVLEF